MSNMHNDQWLAVTACRIFDQVMNPADGNEDLIGTYLNDVREVVGTDRFMKWLSLFNNFGLETRHRQRLQRKARQDNAAAK